MTHLVKLTFTIPITTKLLAETSGIGTWVWLEDKVIAMEKNHWLENKDRLQPHKAKDIL